MAEVRCTRRLWQALSFTIRAGRPLSKQARAKRSGIYRAITLVVLIACFVLVLWPYGDFFSWRPWLLTIPLLLLAMPFVALFPRAIGDCWWRYGAGEPIFVIDPVSAKGRIARAGNTPRSANDWDFEVATTDCAMRLDAGGNLVVTLPPEVAAALLTGTDTADIATVWARRFGTPVMWPLRSIYAGRADELTELLAELTTYGMRTS